MQRRQFIQKASGTALVSAAAFSRILGANDRVNVALVGCGGRGREDAGLLRQIPGVNIVAVCDVYQPHAAAAKAWAGTGCQFYSDFRRLLEQKEIDAVLVATPDHWHAGVTVLACQAGKDVYVEKPLAHSICEGRKMVEAARRYNRVVQTGTQHRSAPHIQQAAEIVHSGQIGPVHFVRVWNYLNMSPDGIGQSADSAPPAGLDWDFYLGPAPAVPFNRNRFLVSYRWFWDYAGGMATDYGTHRLDSVHQIMGVDAPRSAVAAGGRYELKDGAETPDMLQITYEYPGFVLSYEASIPSAKELSADLERLRGLALAPESFAHRPERHWFTLLVLVLAATALGSSDRRFQREQAGRPVARKRQSREHSFARGAAA